MARRIRRGTDEALQRAERILSGAPPEGGLAEEYARLAESYRLLHKKLDKTLAISDAYQAQVREHNAALALRVEEEIGKRLAHERLMAQNAKLAAMGEMLGAIAHQWRQPLATIGMQVQLLRAIVRSGRLDAEQLEETSREAMEQIQCLSETIDTFRGFLRPAKERLPFRIGEKVLQAVSYLRPRLAADAVALSLDLDAAGDTVVGYPNEFTQAILSLVNNSYDAVMIRRRSAGDRSDAGIALRLSVAAGWAVLEVCDGGCGIAPQVAGRIFEPYFTTKEDGTGTGIGLYLAKLIIEENMGGRLDFSQEPGGTVFRVTLPTVGVP